MGCVDFILTRMHSSKMRTTRLSDSLLHYTPLPHMPRMPCMSPCHTHTPAPCHTCPFLPWMPPCHTLHPATHAPFCHGCPPATHHTLPHMPPCHAHPLPHIPLAMNAPRPCEQNHRLHLRAVNITSHNVIVRTNKIL